jgi:hypothetical protein
MKTFKTLFFSIFIVMLLVSVGCKSSQPTVQVVHDSIFVEKTKTVTIVDTVIKIPASHVGLTFPCDSFKQGLNPVSKTVKNAKLTVHRQSGNSLKIDCNCDTVEIKAKLLHTLETEYKARSQIQNSTTVERVKYTPWHIIALAWLGGLFLIGLVGYFGFKAVLR